MKGILILLVFFCFSPMADAAEVYRWVDDQGVTHFTDDPAAVPEHYRSETKKIEMPGQQTGEPAADVHDEYGEYEEGILVEDDLKEKDEAWWQNRAKTWKARLEEAYDNYEKTRLRYNTMATEFNASQDPEERKELRAELSAMQASMDKLKADIENARKMKEEVLPSQAQKAGIPLEWVR
jgi:hypothetical protein